MTIWIDPKCSTTLLSFWSLQKHERLSILTQKSAGVHRHAFNLKELLADMMLRPHSPRSASPPGPGPSHKSPASPSCSHTLTASTVVQCMSFPKLIAFVFLHCMAFGVVYNLQQLYYVIFVTQDPRFGSFDRGTKRKLKIMSSEVDSAYHTESSMKAFRNGCGFLCAASLMVLYDISQEALHQIEIDLTTARLFTKERQGSHITS